MNKKTDDFLNYIKGKRVALLGFGISNSSIVDFLLGAGAKVTVRDKKENIAGRDGYEARGVRFITGEEYLSGMDEDILFRSPGIRADTPEIAQAVAHGAVLTGEMEAFCTLFAGRIYAVTGSDGKTTTTTIIHKILTEEYKDTDKKIYLGGNIGFPLLSKIGEMSENDIAVLELSSFQLSTMKFAPHAAVVTNITPNHLNWHRDMAEYIECKKNIFRGMTGGRLVVNDGNDITRDFVNPAGETVRFSSKGKPRGKSVYLDGREIFFCDGETRKRIMSLDDIKLRGMHNVENYMAAIAALHGEVKTESILAVSRSFGGVKHRIELICEHGGVKYYNSSIDTSPTRSIAALVSFDEKLIVVCGGYDKHIPIEPLIPVLSERAKAVFATGQTGRELAEKLAAYSGAEKPAYISYTENFDDAVRSALAYAAAGDTVILSPAAASFDAFANFEERGERFRTIVKEYIEREK